MFPLVQLLDCVGAFFEWNFPEIQVKFYLTREVSNNDRGKTVLCWEFSTKGEISFYTKHFDFYFLALYLSWALFTFLLLSTADKKVH